MSRIYVKKFNKIPRASAKLARQMVSLNRDRKMQIMRNPRVFAGAYRKPVLGEKKYLDTTLFNNTAIGNDMAAAIAVQSLNIVPQGLTVNTREGKKLRCMRLQLKGRIQTAGVCQSTALRVAIVWDREPDKAALVPTQTDIWIASDPAALTNRDNAPRFKILKDMQFTFPGNVSAVASEADDSIQHFEEFMDFSKKSLECIWTKTDTTGAVAALVKGDLLFCVLPSATIAVGGLIMSCNARLDFSDSSS